MTHDDTHDDSDDEQESPTRADVLKAALGLTTDSENIPLTDDAARAANGLTAGSLDTTTVRIESDRFDEIVIDHDGDTYRVVETADGLGLEREGDE